MTQETKEPEQQPIVISLGYLNQLLNVLDKTKPVEPLTRELHGKAVDVLEAIVKEAVKFTENRDANFVLQKPVEEVKEDKSTPKGKK